MTRLGLCAGVAAVLALPTLAAVGSAQRSDEVTLTLREVRGGNVLALVFSGSTPGGTVGEAIEVLGWDCGRSAYRLIASTEVRAGGTWEVQNPSLDPPYRWVPVGSGTTFRARWNERLSDPAVFRFPANVWARRVSGTRTWKVHVVTEPPGRFALDGKVVQLQQRTNGRWIPYRSAQLAHKPGFGHGPYNYEATFSVPARGLRLRAFLPKASARPCYLAAATPPWRT